MSNKIQTKKVALFIAALLVTTVGVITSITVWSQQNENPSSRESASPAPSRLIASKNRSIPSLTVAGKNAQATVAEFIKFAGQSGVDQREEIRQTLAAARENREAINALCKEIFAAQREDHTRALLTLSLLGEIKSQQGGECLNRFLSIPFPKAGRVVDGEILEQTALGKLQAKAIDGLAYLNTKEANEIVLNAVKNHPSKNVRAEAIEAYLWNNRNKAYEARQTLMQYVRKGEEIYLDRVRRETGEDAKSFNRKLNAYLKAHPEVIPPRPEYAKERTAPSYDKPGRITNPPKF